MAGMKTIIGLAFLLAVGILLVILSCALYGVWLPLLVVLTYVLAPIPNILCKRIAGAGGDFFNEEHRGVLETGYFLTAIFVVSGFGIPIVLEHANQITQPAMFLSILGGLMIYFTILGYMHFFVTVEEPY
ncbi:Vacuolar protein sorting-associated protein 55 [Rhizophlyctis rosea]|nr:Vacuolar protein sorting-associated protein 55 [Rhizophlyctis rosea]